MEKRRRKLRRKDYRIITEPRRLMRVGNSVVIALPSEFLERHDLKPGDDVGVVADSILKVVPLKEIN